MDDNPVTQLSAGEKIRMELEESLFRRVTSQVRNLWMTSLKEMESLFESQFNQMVSEFGGKNKVLFSNQKILENQIEKHKQNTDKQLTIISTKINEINSRLDKIQTQTASVPIDTTSSCILDIPNHVQKSQIKSVKKTNSSIEQIKLPPIGDIDKENDEDNTNNEDVNRNNIDDNENVDRDNTDDESDVNQDYDDTNTLNDNEDNDTQ